MANTYLTRTFQSGGNRKKWTMSMWVKRSALGATNILFQTYVSTYTFCPFDSNDRLQFQDGSGGNKVTSMKFRDTSAWYHIVVAIDTDNSTADDRYKIYVNGNRITDFETSTNPSSGYEGEWNKAQLHNIGRHHSSGNYFNGLMSHIHFCDGYQYQASDFGSFDSTTGEWKINTSPNVSYGTTGFFILKDGNTVTDSSSNSNTWTANGTLTKTEDNPSNVFATFNPLVKTNSTTFSNGNTTLTSGSTQWNGAMTTIPLFGGKWYYECKYINGGNIKFDVVGEQSDYRNMATLNSSYGGYHGNGYGYQFNNSGNDYIGGNNSFPNWGGGLSSNTGNKIFMVAINLENGKIWYGADGTWFNDASGYTGNPTTDAYPHQTISATHLAQKPFIVTGSLEGNSDVSHWNFGNGFFGTSQISSEGTNASGIGKFEYDVPTGFTAISTKGLNL